MPDKTDKPADEHFRKAMQRLMEILDSARGAVGATRHQQQIHPDKKTDDGLKRSLEQVEEGLKQSQEELKRFLPPDESKA
jgi:hypothetical protein